MQQRHFYKSFNARWKQIVSKDDIVQVVVDNEWKKGTAIQLNSNIVQIRLNDTGKIVNVGCSNIRILEKKIKQDQEVPVEVNDLVTCFVEKDMVSAIVTQVQSFVKVVITSQKNYGKDSFLPSDSLQFVAKGYTFCPNQNVDENSSGGSNAPGPSNQMNSGMAILYPSPCIIMAIPPASEPADFPEAMAVQFPWSEDSPTILPVIRMGPGTMVVVVPASTPPGTMASQGLVQVPVQSPTPI